MIRLVATVTAAVSMFSGAEIAQAAASGGAILSSGPLSRIEITSDLGCAVGYADDSHGEFYGDTACGTLIAVGGTLYGPAYIPAGGAAEPRTAWTPLSQESGGAGTIANPYRVITRVGGGGLEVTQTDTYVVGSEAYGTRVEIANNTGSTKTVTLYRAGDCYLQDSDFGYGQVDSASGAVACTAGSEPGSRIEQWAPLTPGSHYYEAFYSDVWAAIGSQGPFADTCECSTFLDNGAGLSWTTGVGAGAARSFSHLTAFSPTGVEVSDTDGDGFPDTWEEPGGGVDTDGDTVADLRLSDYGATPDKRDIFVQVGWLDGRSCFLFFCSTHNHRPSLAALREVQKAFAAHGIRLHIDAGSNSLMNPDNGARWGSRSRAHGTTGPERIPGETKSGFDWTEAFDDYRNELLPAARAQIFHFALYVGTWDAEKHSGRARPGGSAGYAGPDLIIADDAFGSGGPKRMEEAGTFMHELGHNLSLSHGGSLAEDTVNYKVNYPSVMNYAWQFSGVYKYSTLGLLDYSDGTLQPINESSVSETAGLEPNSAAVDIATKWSCPDGSYVGPSPSAFNVDWNCNHKTDGGSFKANLNNPYWESDPTISTLRDYDDWANLVFDGGGALGGAGDPVAREEVTATEEAPTADLEAAAGEPWTVDLTGPEQLTMQSHTSAPVGLRITNRDDRPHSYDLAVIAEGVSLSGLPESIALGPGESRGLTPTVTAGSATDTAFFEVDAASSEPANGDSAVAEVFVVDHEVPDQPGLRSAASAAPATAPQAGTPSPRISILTRRARLRAGGKVTIKLACGTGDGRCSGRLSLSPRSHKRGSKKAGSAKRRRARRSAAFSIAAGRQARVTVRLRRPLRRRLLRTPRRRLNLIAQAKTSTNTARRSVVVFGKRRRSGPGRR